jgi:L-ascorbate metabolism protein UlaG (beta-lactamase superfamily)
MQITYFGLSSFKITSKDRVAITDPFDKSSGLTPPRGAADLVFLSEKSNELYSCTSGISGDPFIVDGPGEYDVKDHAINAVPVQTKDGRVITLYLIDVEGIKILNLAHIKNLSLTDDEVEDLGEVDVLIVPVGGHDAMEAEDAAKVVNLLDPKIVIPSHYKTDGLKIAAESAEKFLRLAGGKFETLDKLTIKKKDLDPEAARIVVLEPMR